jgi:hypothetical protein
VRNKRDDSIPGSDRFFSAKKERRREKRGGGKKGGKEEQRKGAAAVPSIWPVHSFSKLAAAQCTALFPG